MSRGAFCLALLSLCFVCLPTKCVAVLSYLYSIRCFEFEISFS